VNVGPRHLHTGPSQLAQLQALTELQSNGFLGALNITVTSVHAADGKSLALDDLKMKYFIGEDEGFAFVLAEKITRNLKTKECVIRFEGSFLNSESSSGNAESVDSSNRISFLASFDCKEAPEDTSLTCDLDATSGLTFRVIAGFDACIECIASKKTELTQNETECRKIMHDIQEARRSGSSGANSNSTPGKNKSTRVSKLSDCSSASGASPTSSVFASGGMVWSKVVAQASAAGEVLLHSRAYWLFAASSTLIYLYGEHASI
jgi:hypothetical protein